MNGDLPAVGPLQSSKWLHLGEGSFALLYGGQNEISIPSFVLERLFKWNGQPGPLRLLCPNQEVSINTSTRNSTPNWTNPSALKKALGLDRDDYLVLERQGRRVAASAIKAGSKRAAEVAALRGIASPASAAKRTRPAAAPALASPLAAKLEKQVQKKKEDRQEDKRRKKAQQAQRQVQDSSDSSDSDEDTDTESEEEEGEEEEGEAQPPALKRSKAGAVEDGCPPGPGPWNTCPRDPFCVHMGNHRGNCRIRRPIPVEPVQQQQHMEGEGEERSAGNGLFELADAAAVAAASPGTRKGLVSPQGQAGCQPLRLRQQQAPELEEQELTAAKANGKAPAAAKKRGRPPKQHVKAAVAAAAKRLARRQLEEEEEERPSNRNARQGLAPPQRRQQQQQQLEEVQEPRGSDQQARHASRWAALQEQQRRGEGHEADRGGKMRRRAEGGALPADHPEVLFAGGDERTRACLHLGRFMSQLEREGVLQHRHTGNHDATIPFDPVYTYTRMWYLRKQDELLPPQQRTHLRDWLMRLARDKMESADDGVHDPPEAAGVGAAQRHQQRHQRRQQEEQQWHGEGDEYWDGEGAEEEEQVEEEFYE